MNQNARRYLITAGPTHEPIDAVRYIGNRSSGRLGVALADAARERGHHVTLLLGPTHLLPSRADVHLRRFRTTADLERLLLAELPGADVLIMAAAVADYRPASTQLDAKIKRLEGPLTITLESTPDLLAACAARRAPGQTIVGFALEPRERLLASAQSKITRKSLDAIVANPLETMDAPDIEAFFIRADGTSDHTRGPIAKETFAPWLLDHIERLHAGRA